MTTTLRIVLASAVAVGRTKIQTLGLPAYVLVWMTFPIGNLLIVGLIYADSPELRDYAVIGGTSLALLFGMLFSAGELLDQERLRGTLGNLLLAPCSRYAWLGGFQLFAVAESLTTATLTLTTGTLVFGLRLDVDPMALVVVLVLFGCCLWGFSMVAGAVGVAVRDANQVSNLLFVPVVLLSGALYPVAATPDWLRVPAELLPFGHGVQALADATTQGASVAELWPGLAPLLAYAVVLPMLGVAAFRRIERRSRRLGTLELV